MRPASIAQWIGMGLAVAGTLGSPTLAQEAAKADACTAFKWSLTREQAWMSAPGLQRIVAGDALTADHPAAVLGLRRSEDADLPHPVSREAKAGTYAGAVNGPAPGVAGTYQITLSDEGWIDVFQDGEMRKPSDHTGSKGCGGLRKSLRFDLSARPFVIQITNAQANTIRIAVAPVEAMP